MYDLVVVGAGPVGSFLAWKFAEEGKGVLLLEKDEVGEPLRCTGHISKDLFNFVPRRDGFIENRIRKGIFHNNGDTYMFGGGEVLSYVIDRGRFDRFLAQRAEENGVDIRNETFRTLRRGGGKVLVSTDKDSYETKLLAGCDGPHSDVRRAAGLPEPGRFLHGIFTKTEVGAGEDYVEIYLDASEDFFGWRVPRKDDVEYGLATVAGKDAKGALERFSRSEDFKINKIYSGVIPLLPPGRTASRRIFLCGDAAAQVKPFTGGGVIYGLISASLASRNIDPERPGTVWKYEKNWRSKLGREIWIGNRIRKFYSWPPKLRRPFLKLAENLPEESQMDRPSSLLKFPSPF